MRIQSPLDSLSRPPLVPKKKAPLLDVVSSPRPGMSINTAVPLPFSLPPQPQRKNYRKIDPSSGFCKTTLHRTQQLVGSGELGKAAQEIALLATETMAKDILLNRYPASPIPSLHARMLEIIELLPLAPVRKKSLFGLSEAAVCKDKNLLTKKLLEYATPKQDLRSLALQIGYFNIALKKEKVGSPAQEKLYMTSVLLRYADQRIQQAIEESSRSFCVTPDASPTKEDQSSVLPQLSTQDSDATASLVSVLPHPKDSSFVSRKNCLAFIGNGITLGLERLVRAHKIRSS